MDDLISVIVPVYNVESYLERCVDSIIDQTYKNLEILLIDDGSTDKSGKICDRIAKKDERITVYHKLNGGLSDARNYGIDHAHGKFITFVDSDDIISIKMIEELFRLIKVYNSDISICDPIHIFEKKLERNKFEDATDVKCLSSKNALNMMFYQKDFLVSAWGKLYKRDLFRTIRFPIGMLFEDIAIMYELFSICQNIVYSNAKYYGYIHRENSITTKQFSHKDLDILKICDSLEDFSKSHPYCEKSIRSYIVGANFRIYLNAPRTAEYSSVIIKNKKTISKNAFAVLQDSNVRRKLKIALILFLVNKNLLKKIYPKINRWK